MGLEMNNQKLSKCHKAPVKLIGGTGDFSDHEEGITMHYECEKCGEPCDFYVPEQKLREEILRAIGYCEHSDNKGSFLDMETDVERKIEKVEALLSTQQISLLEEIKKQLPKEIEEGDGWEIFFSHGKEKGKVRSCCPGDDIAYVHNQYRKKALNVIKAKKKEIVYE